MTLQVKLLFDECIGKPVMDQFGHALNLSTSQPQLKHILDYQKQGVFDEDWIPERAGEGWIVISADKGRRGKKSKGEKLPKLCTLYKITHVLMSGTIHQMNSVKKLSLLLSVWDELSKLPQAPRGSRHSLRLTKTGAARIVQVDPPPVAALNVPPKKT